MQEGSAGRTRIKKVKGNVQEDDCRMNKHKVIFTLFIPYLLWVSIAMILNLNLWLLN